MNKYDVAAYVWPAYTKDEPRSRIFWDEGIGEWETVKNSVKKFPEHSWPRKPLWGYVNESDPEVMEMEIEKATQHGVNVFIYDWYWYDGRPFLEQCLNDGFLKAKNRELMKFYIMWANHNANNVWRYGRTHEDDDTIVWKYASSRAEFEMIAERIIEKYFSQPNYYQIDGCPVFMIYEIRNLVEGLGGIEETADAIEWFRQKTKEAGFKNLHLQLAVQCNDMKALSGVDTEGECIDYRMLRPDSITHYQYVHFVNVNRDYLDIIEDVEKEYNKMKKLDITYFPHVSCGWDNNPRYKRLVDEVVKNNTPENFEKALMLAKNYIDENNMSPKLITINSWNEWTETSYLQPDDLYGYGYLEAVKKVFG